MRPGEEQDLFEAIPEPDVVRERLSENLRDAKQLRQLLRLAERVKRADEKVKPKQRRGDGGGR